MKIVMDGITAGMNVAAPAYIADIDMRNKPTQSELVVRILRSRNGAWVPSYDLVKQETPHGYVGLQGDRRAFEIAKDGYWDSRINRYFVEHKKEGKFAFFRISKVEKLPVVVRGQTLKDWTFAPV